MIRKMFKFDFDLEDISADPDLDLIQEPPTNVRAERSKNWENAVLAEESCKEISVHDLLDVLPSLISCSPISTPVRDGSKVITLYRRDLFDARFQLIAEGPGTDRLSMIPGPGSLNTADSEVKGQESFEEANEQRHKIALKFIEAPSDLVPRVYEGGLKTWECSIDLVEYLDSTQPPASFSGKSVLELGCGTAVPSLYILHRLFAESSNSARGKTTLYLQDYNESVLELVTLPNVLLTWYLSPASLSYRTSVSTSSSSPDILPFPKTPEPFELPITTDLKSAFLASLKSYNISLHFFSGSWSSFATQLPTLHLKIFDFVLTSETIYRIDSLPSLVEVMRGASTFNSSDTTTITNTDGNQIQKQGVGVCLVAAKVLYFGVGGGVSDFVEFVEGNGYAKTRVVWERKMGVGRLIMSLNF